MVFSMKCDVQQKWFGPHFSVGCRAFECGCDVQQGTRLAADWLGGPITTMGAGVVGTTDNEAILLSQSIANRRIP